MPTVRKRTCRAGLSEIQLAAEYASGWCLIPSSEPWNWANSKTPEELETFFRKHKQQIIGTAGRLGLELFNEYKQNAKNP